MNFFSVLFFVMIAIHSYGNVSATQKTPSTNALILDNSIVESQSVIARKDPKDGLKIENR